MTINTDADIIIVGGGHVGLTCALGLAESDLRVHLVDAQAFQPLATAGDYDLRVSAITPVSKRIFEVLSVWDKITDLRISEFYKIDVWEKNFPTHLEFNSENINEKALGYIIENNIIQTALFKQLKNYPNIIYDAPAIVDKIQITPDLATVILNNGKSLSAKLIIGADGAQSRVRTLANITHDTKIYQQHGLVTTVQTALSHAHIARQCFLHSGPLAFLPLADKNHCSIVWSHDSGIAKELLDLPDVEFNTALQDAFGSVLGELRVVSKRLIFPLLQRHVKNYVQPRVALIGDAAHSVHPLAGQGVNLGLLDAVSLAEIVIDAKQQHKDIGLMHTLRRYERWRKSDNLSMIYVIDALHCLFKQQQLPLGLLRNMGLRITNRCQPIKNKIMQHALGFSHELPALIRQIKTEG